MTDAPKTLGEMREAAKAHAVTFCYTNWRGETATRRAVPIGLAWRATEHHPEPQWIMRALDLDKNAPRDFALKDCDFRALSLSAMRGEP